MSRALDPGIRYGIRSGHSTRGAAKTFVATVDGDRRVLAAFVRVTPWTASGTVAAVIPRAAPCPAICEQADNSA